MMKDFREDVLSGLSKEKKRLDSKYFYDEVGDDLFVKIMGMPEYYLTRAEYDIFENQSKQIIDALGVEKDRYFELIELGAGNGRKTKLLLNELLDQGFDFSYLPIDISQSALDQLQSSLNNEIQTLEVNPQQGDYFGILSSLSIKSDPKIVLFLGSNIGNMEDEDARSFLNQLAERLNVGDRLLLGVDLIKDENIILPAYNDAQGYTSAFNLNLLKRINDELGGEFILEQFTHAPVYDKEMGAAVSYLESSVDQSVNIKSLERSFHFEKGERIYMEISRKYNDEILDGLLNQNSFHRITKLTDSNEYFADYILEKR